MAKKPAATQPVPSFTPTRIAAISLPSISLAAMEEGDSFYFKAIAPIEDKPDLDKKGGQKIDPDTEQPQFLHILRVIRLADGLMGEIVLGHIVNKDLTTMAQRGETYVGRCFEIVKGEKKGRTNMWSVFEIADPTA